MEERELGKNPHTLHSEEEERDTLKDKNLHEPGKVKNEEQALLVRRRNS